MLWTVILYGVTAALVVLSLIKDKKKTKMAMKKAWKAFENILPMFLGMIVLVGLVLAIFDTPTISKIIGQSSGWLGVVVCVAIGSIMLIPGLIAFPTAALLVAGGAGYMQIAAFISALMMVGVMTLPVEFKYFNKKTAILRNVMAFAFSFLVAFVIGKVMGEI